MFAHLHLNVMRAGIRKRINMKAKSWILAVAGDYPLHPRPTGMAASALSTGTLLAPVPGGNLAVNLGRVVTGFTTSLTVFPSLDPFVTLENPLVGAPAVFVHFSLFSFSIAPAPCGRFATVSLLLPFSIAVNLLCSGGWNILSFEVATSAVFGITLCESSGFSETNLAAGAIKRAGIGAFSNWGDSSSLDVPMEEDDVMGDSESP